MQKIKLTNYADIVRAQHGYLAPELIRSIEVDASIDSRVTTLALPADLIAQVGIKSVCPVDGSIVDSRRVIGIRLEICGRDMLTSAYVMPAGTTPLIGKIPLAELDLIIDPGRQGLRPNPEHPDGPIIDAMAAA
jgi:hypothetical protein